MSLSEIRLHMYILMALKVTACIYTFGSHGGPGEELFKGLENLLTGPLSKLFKPSPLIGEDLGEDGSVGESKDDGFLHLGIPDDVDVSLELKDWLFALEGAQEMAERWRLYNNEGVGREERCWHTSFQNLLVKDGSSPKDKLNGKVKSQGIDILLVELVMVGVEGLQILKPLEQKGRTVNANGIKDVDTSGGINLEVRMVISQENAEDEMAKWMVENLKFSVK